MRNKKLQIQRSSVNFSFDINKINCRELMEYPKFRRLYSIVCFDETTTNDRFRPQLIKELYFLLQITPHICKELREQFLLKVEQWYNKHDRKRIQLSPNMKKVMENIRYAKSRPKTTEEVGKIRTGFRPKTQKQKVSRFRKIQEVKQQKQTNHESKQMQTISQNTVSGEKYLNCDYKSISRTFHHDEEPASEKLKSLFKIQKNEGAPQSRRTAPFSATWVKKKTFKTQGNNANQNDEIVLSFGESQLLISHNQRENSDISSKSEEAESDFEAKKFIRNKPFQKDSKFNHEKRKFILIPKGKPNANKVLQAKHFYQNVSKLRSYKEKQQLTKEEIIYQRMKSNRRKNNTRKIQVKGFLKKKYSKLQIPCKTENSTTMQLDSSINDKMINISSFEQDFSQDQEPFYNKREFFAGRTTKKISKSLKQIKTIPTESCEKQNDEIGSIIFAKRFKDDKTFDPLHESNKARYNRQALNQIENIKQKMRGNNYFFCNSLTKALQVDIINKKDIDWSGIDRTYLMMRKESVRQKKKKLKKRRK